MQMKEIISGENYGDRNNITERLISETTWKRNNKIYLSIYLHDLINLSHLSIYLSHSAHIYLSIYLYNLSLFISIIPYIYLILFHLQKYFSSTFFITLQFGLVWFGFMAY